MARRTRCPECQTALKVPDEAGQKRLKCPSCGTKFYAERPAPEGGRGGPSSSSAIEGLPEAGPASSTSNPRGPVVGDDLILPTVTKDLRESFDVPLLSDDTPPPSSARPTSAGEVLIDVGPAAPRKAGAAEARKKARRCTCGAVVPQGMSLCTRCGLDLDTGVRINVEELLEEPVALPPPPGPPMGVLFVGVATLLVSVLLGFASTYVYMSGRGGERAWGYLLLTLVCVFGVYGSVRFLQGRTARLILIALLMGGGIDLVGMVMLPILVPEESIASGGLSDSSGKAEPEAKIDLGPYETKGEEISLEEEFAPAIRPLTEQINWRQVYAGLIILLVTAGLVVYLTSPPIRRYFERRRMVELPSMGGGNSF